MYKVSQVTKRALSRLPKAVPAVSFHVSTPANAVRQPASNQDKKPSTELASKRTTVSPVTGRRFSDVAGQSASPSEFALLREGQPRADVEEELQRLRGHGAFQHPLSSRLSGLLNGQFEELPSSGVEFTLFREFVLARGHLMQSSAADMEAELNRIGQDLYGLAPLTREQAYEDAVARSPAFENFAKQVKDLANGGGCASLLFDALLQAGTRGDGKPPGAEAALQGIDTPQQADNVVHALKSMADAQLEALSELGKELDSNPQVYLCRGVAERLKLPVFDRHHFFLRITPTSLQVTQNLHERRIYCRDRMLSHFARSPDYTKLKRAFAEAGWGSELGTIVPFDDDVELTRYQSFAKDIGDSRLLSRISRALGANIGAHKSAQAFVETFEARAGTIKSIEEADAALRAIDDYAKILDEELNDIQEKSSQLYLPTLSGGH